MFTHRAVLVSVIVAFANAAFATETPKFGRPISESDIKAWDTAIGPDGFGLPAGSGTVAQGAVIYAQKCAGCHGLKGEGGNGGQRLVGGFGTLAVPNPNPVRTIGSYVPYAVPVFDFVRRTMPWTAPKTLSGDETYALVAYIFALNGIIKDGDVMNARTLPRVHMPNENGFIDIYPSKY